MGYTEHRIFQCINSTFWTLDKFASKRGVRSDTQKQKCDENQTFLKLCLIDSKHQICEFVLEIEFYPFQYAELGPVTLFSNSMAC